MKIHYKLEQRSPEWFAARCGRPTCSELSKLLTPAKLELSKSAHNFALVKAAERITKQVEQSHTSWAMQRGVDLEPVARDYYQRATNAEVEQIGFVECDDYGFMLGYSPDGFVGEQGLLEIKCPSPAVHLDTLLNGSIDGAYILQMQGGMLATGREWCDFVSFSEGLALKPIRVHRDNVIIGKIMEAGQQFEELVMIAIVEHRELIELGALLTDIIPTLEAV